MSKRDVRVASVGLNKPVILKDCEAKDFGELKSCLRKANISYDNMVVIVRETKQTLELDDAQLPTGQFGVFLYAKKMKSGTKAKAKVVKKAAPKKVAKKPVKKAPAKKAPVKKAAAPKVDKDDDSFMDEYKTVSNKIKR